MSECVRTGAQAGRAREQILIVAVALVAACLAHSFVYAVPLDQAGEMKLGLRTYVGTRVGTEATDRLDNGREFSQSFPFSAAGHVRQMRYFIEAELDHDLKRLVSEGFGPLALLNDLPFRVSDLRYHLTFRGEGEGIYDFGPREYRTAEASFNDISIFTGDAPTGEQIREQRRRLRRLAVHRERLFQAFVDAQIGGVFIRFGRQILVWGETDGFRLLDNINPLDSSFGGFLIALDERRKPLDMLRANYYWGNLGPVYDLFFEGYVAVDKAVGWFPRTPAGSPWTLPNLASASDVVFPVFRRPARAISSARGGGQIKFNAPAPLIDDVTLAIAHYYTYSDVPAVDDRVTRGDFPGVPVAFPETDSDGAGGAFVKSVLSPPRMQITGLTSTFTVPSRYARRVGLSGEPVIRTELAYFRDEPRFTQAQLDPWVIIQKPECVAAAPRSECAGGRRLGDSWNFVLGIDHSQFIRFLNPRQSFFFSTQFFYKHLKGAAERKILFPQAVLPAQRKFADGEVLPVPEFFNTDRSGFIAEPSFIRNPVDQYLQTLLIATSYYSSQVNPALALFYDWSGAWVVQPGVTFARDPYRFTINYSYLEADRLKGASGVSLLRDRDNVFFQLTYVL